MSLRGFKILRNEKLDTDTVDNPEGLPFVDLIFRNEQGRITGWHSVNKEQLETIVRDLQQKLATL